MAHLGSHFAKEAGDLVLCELGGADVPVVGADTGSESGIASGVQGFLYPCEEGGILGCSQSKVLWLDLPQVALGHLRNPLIDHTVSKVKPI